MYRYWIKMHFYLISDGTKKANWVREHNVFHFVGKNCSIKTAILPAEPFLVALHDNVFLAADVRLITHSLTCDVFNKKTNRKDFYCQHGKIEIHENVFVGSGAIIMYGVIIGKNCIVAAGAVVTKDVPSGSVVAGIPAKVIGTFSESMRKADLFSQYYREKSSGYSVAEMLKVKPIEFDIDKK